MINIDEKLVQNLRREKCASCYWYNPVIKDETGECHAQPPQVAPVHGGQSHFALVNENSFCGQWKQASEEILRHLDYVKSEQDRVFGRRRRMRRSA